MKATYYRDKTDGSCVAVYRSTRRTTKLATWFQCVSPVHPTQGTAVCRPEISAAFLRQYCERIQKTTAPTWLVQAAEI